jgi:hypothetical protein
MPKFHGHQRPRRDRGTPPRLTRRQRGRLPLPDDIVEWQLANHRKFPAAMYASMYHDLARGKRLELEGLSGLIVRKGRELGVPTPFHALAYACLKPYVAGGAWRTEKGTFIERHEPQARA